jgi:anti-sigma-K factor RskA
MKTHDEIQADLSLFVLGSLDEEDRRSIETHLATTCVECERELEAWRGVVESMPLGLTDQSPPDLKSTLLRRLRGQADAPAKVRRLPRVVIPLALAAAAVLALAVGREMHWRSELADQRSATADLRKQLDEAGGRLADVARVLSERERDVVGLRAALKTAQESLGLLQTRGLQLVRLSQTPDARPAEGHAIIGRDAGRALFYAFDLPGVQDNQTYELWWITEKEGPVNAGLFVPGADGVGRVEVSVPANAGAIQAAAVTIEPAGGVAKPTGPMVLLGKITSL